MQPNEPNCVIDKSNKCLKREKLTKFMTFFTFLIALLCMLSIFFADELMYYFTVLSMTIFAFVISFLFLLCFILSIISFILNRKKGIISLVPVMILTCAIIIILVLPLQTFHNALTFEVYKNERTEVLQEIKEQYSFDNDTGLRALQFQDKLPANEKVHILDDYPLSIYFSTFGFLDTSHGFLYVEDPIFIDSQTKTMRIGARVFRVRDAYDKGWYFVSDFTDA